MGISALENNESSPESEKVGHDNGTVALAAVPCGETNEKFTNSAHPDFQAPPTFVGSLAGSRILPSDFPRFGVGMDAGKSVECFAPIRPGDEITGKSHLHEIYAKTLMCMCMYST